MSSGEWFTLPGAPGRGGVDGPVGRSPLESLLRRAGATIRTEDGWRVAAHFGSAAGELSVCQRSVGLADRSHLGKLELQGDADSVAQVVGDVAERALGTTGTAARGARAWWCLLTPRRVLVLADSPDHARVRERLEDAAARAPSATVADVTMGFAAIAVVGPAARQLLSRVSAADLSPSAWPEGDVRPITLGEVRSALLRDGDDRFVAVVGSAYAVGVWAALEAAGHPLGASCVGHEALDRLGAAHLGMAHRA